MSRVKRKLSNSKVYHIILKGVDSQNIFYDNQDRNFFLKQISKTKKEFNYIVYAYCLMINHVHMVISVKDDFLSKSMQSLIIRYVRYFNSKYMRTGTLIQGRFKSKCVENREYFLEVCRYVHRNPEKAGIANTQNYKWSSYNEYLGVEKIVNKSVLLHYFDDNVNEFIKYTTKLEDVDNWDDYAEYEIISKLSDEQLSRIIMEKFNICDIKKIATFFRKRKKEDLSRDIKIIKNIKGAYMTQVSRVIRINRKLVRRFWENCP